MYDKNGKLTREGAIKVIQSGGSVLFNKNLYTKVESLPNEADFAKGDEQAEAAARASLQKTIDDAQKQLSQLGKPAQSAQQPIGQQPQTRNPDSLDDLTVVQLKEKAKDANVEGYGTMNKADLIAALRKA
jgi:hypothetical protein